MNNPITFRQKPAHITEFKVGDSICRENFLSFIILSFAVSRGHTEIQKMFFAWIQKLTGFLHPQVLENFVTAGAFDCLSQEEQLRFRSAFFKVAKHLEKFHESELEDEMRDELTALHLRKENIVIMKTVLSFFEFESIKNISEFNECAAKYISTHKVKK